ncbi:hypothetical protein HW555_014077, partial [Spodoptera exigua]
TIILTTCHKSNDCSKDGGNCMNYVEVKNEYKRYKMGETTITANEDISFAIKKGELAVILGPSGAGKSTVLNILGGMDTPDEGQIIIDETDIAKFSDKELTMYRREAIGFVFQFYNLVPNLTAKENVELATEISPNALDPVEVLTQVGLEDRLNNFPSQLSGGEQQRVSIARALAKNPKLLLCDEPTGALDFETGKQVLKLLQNASRLNGNTVLIITHNAAIAPIADRVIRINDAKVRSVEVISTLGISEADEALAKKIPDAKVESGYQFYYADAKKNEVVQILSYNEKNQQNQLVLKEGRLPKSETEIVLDDTAVKDGYKIGDTFSINDDEKLKNKEYSIVGFVNSPLFISTTERGYSNVGNGTVDYFVYVPESNFKTDVKSVLYIRFDNIKGLETYSQEYKNQLEKNRDSVKELFKNRPEERLSEIQDEAHTKLTEAKTNLADGLAQLEAGQGQLNQAQDQLNQKKQALQQLPEGQQATLMSQFTNAESELAVQQAELDKNKIKLEKAQQEMTTNEAEINQMKVPTYLFNVRADNPGFQEYGDLSERIAAIADVFPVFFFFIAALITFTTMTRMVEENRREIGTLKALGYTKFEISKKYIIYALLASALGIITGVIAGTELLPRIIYELSSDRYTLGGVKIYYVSTPIIQATLAFLAAALGSALLVLFRELHDKPAQLLQARAPKPGKRLMVAGFGLKDSLSSVTDQQFGPIIDYQAIVTLNDDADVAKDQEKVIAELNTESAVKNHLMIHSETIELRASGKANLNVTMNVPEDKTKFENYNHMTSVDGQTVLLSDQGGFITQRAAELYGISKGDELTIYDQDQEPIKIKIQDTSNMSETAETELSERLLATDKVTNTTFMSTQIKAQEDSMSNLDAIVNELENFQQLKF